VAHLSSCSQASLRRARPTCLVPVPFPSCHSLHSCSYAPWCGHCKNLAPEWASAAESLHGDVKFGAVDATVHSRAAQRFNVKGYPTIITFAAGPKKGDSAGKDYNGGRTAADLVAFAGKMLEEGGVGAEVPQLTSKAQFAEACGAGTKRVCFLAVLPHILDDGAAGRTARIAALQTAAGKQRGRPFRFLWSEVGAQAEAEKQLAVGLVPALYAVRICGLPADIPLPPAFTTATTPSRCAVQNY
jgi:protein disulfide-isomerase A6